MSSGFMYFFRQGFKNITSHKMMSLASVCIMAASLMLLGLFMTVGLNISSFMNDLGDSCELNVYIKADADGRSISELEEDFKNISGVSDVRFYSREDRLSKVSEEVYGEDGYVFSDDINPLRDSYILTVSDLSQSDRICGEASEVDGVEEVVRNSDVISGVETMTRAVRSVGVWIMLIFALLAVFIISNTIKLGMVSRGDEIKIMKIVGATDGFIRAPFVIQGALLGILGAFPASVVVCGGYGAVAHKISLIVSSDIIGVMALSEIARVVVPSFFVIGILVGMLGSYTAVGRYFK